MNDEINIINPQYSNLSLQITKLLPKATKKEQGIYITPRIIIEQLYNRVKQYKGANNLPNFVDILEPSCGTCEIINYLNTQLHDTFIDGIELNPIIFDKIMNLNFTNNKNNTIHLLKRDFTLWNESSNQYNLIFGNPPYVVCKKEMVPDKYKEFITGRPNLFGIFILHSLFMLKPGGILAFIIPKSFLNSSYYAKIRNYIKTICTIVDILDFESNDDFLETQQATMGLILHKQLPLENCNYSLKMGSQYIFSPNTTQLRELLNNSTTLEKLGLSVKTGTVVWNEHKNILTSDSTKTLLLYNSNLSKKNELDLKTFNNEEKHQYISMEGSTAPIIVVNRGNGNSAYKLNYALIDDDQRPYLVENHLNIIYSKTITEKKALLSLFNKVLQSFKNAKTNEFIKVFLGNNGLSKTELETIFPIYLEE